MIPLTLYHHGEEIKINRLIGSYNEGKTKGTLFIAIGGIHGNEPSGVLAIYNIVNKLRKEKIPVNGKVIGIAGNLKALLEKRRFLDNDLNRIFKKSKLKALETKAELTVEDQEAIQILTLLYNEIEEHDEIYFVDCHTTSAQTIPYISVNNYQRSRELASKFNLFNVVGLEKSIPGCLAEFLNKKGYHGFTLEAGQHDDPVSVKNHEAVIWLFLYHCGMVNLNDFDYHEHYNQLDHRRSDIVFHVTEHYVIKPDEQFRMNPGFVNFTEIKQGDALAKNDHKVIRAGHTGRILMPLYQEKGDDGYFIISRKTN